MSGDSLTTSLAGWPTRWSGVAESVVTTLGPNDRWNVAALGLFAPDAAGNALDATAGRDATVEPSDEASADGPDGVTARTWGRTRTRRNFAERGFGVVQFVRDPVTFVEAACSVREEETPVLDAARAWARVTVTQLASGTAGDTDWVDWHLCPVEAAVERRSVTPLSRATPAIVEATVAASRLDIPGYDTAQLRDRIAFYESVVESAGGPRHRAAWDRFEALVDWRADGD